MKKNISIPLKAALLIVVFGLNTVVSFACSIGVDMGFNATHHHNEEAKATPVHGNEKNHHHEKETHNHHNKHKQTSKDDCCTNSVINLSQADKSVPKSTNISSPVFFVLAISAYYTIDISYPSLITGSIKYFVQSYHPPIPDIRIAIQSFQI